MQIKVSPSVLASDFSRLGDEIRRAEKAGADMIHLDVMDGHFVPNLTMGPPVIAAARRVTSLFFDVHLMLTDPFNYVDAFADAGADGITFHIESASDPLKTIEKIYSRGKVPGISLKPATPAQAVFPFLDKVSMILVMTVEPGFGGQHFMQDMVSKIQTLRQEAARRSLPLDIQVDGGIDEKTAPLAVQAGANVLVAGSALYRLEDMGVGIRRFQALSSPETR